MVKSREVRYSSPPETAGALARRSWFRSLADGSAGLSTRLFWIALSVLLSTLAFAPFYQFYLGWIALVPWLLVAGGAKRIFGAFLWGWVSGVLFYAANLWWLWTASTSGMVVLVLYLALYWGLAAALVRGLRLVPVGTPLMAESAWGPPARVLTIAAVWVVCEWLRCYAVPGLAWMPLGNSQTPWLAMCQVADLGGPWVISFWVMAINALAATAWAEGWKARGIKQAGALVATIVVGVAGYGAWRLATTDPQPGLVATVIQSNIPHLPGGARSVSDEEATDQFLRLTREALVSGETDLVVLPEAALPPINDETRLELARAPIGPFLEATYQELRDLAASHGATIVAGASAVLDWQNDGTARVGTRICNSAFLIPPDRGAPLSRYDKTCLVPFSEQAPFRNGPEWLRSLGMLIAAERAAQPLHAGSPNQVSTFTLSAQGGNDVRVVAPICLENIDPRFIAQLVGTGKSGEKRADVIVNLSNDGWFGLQERHQHHQAVPLRCIENRTPMVRASNTGISAIFDSTGKTFATVEAGREGHATARLSLDDRVTLYTQFGDWFVAACSMAAFGATALCAIEHLRRKSLSV